ncbi:uncharacterized protein B0H18DRAFT_951458 [Fomitopsis serialis]|uniref:uncharacterized protein n=1 Tax=Fomitopsis serialis TaxID=139415 RepID=UPI00200720A8|nr:uncharacterized protein B0H18DRAFT_951458 [Neoantrodia serialis]KAH9934970.1 hypothetical protein B0H18DRAFT_951458 [Neoantrodia serialis]
MVSAPAKESAPMLFPSDGKPPYVHLRETTLTFSRPLGGNELGYVLLRRTRGYYDSFTIVSLVCSGGHTITDDEVVQACAALRLRHPLLASKVAYSTMEPPTLVYTSPLTEAHAVREARAQIEIHAFHDQDASTETLRDQWLYANPEEALDLRNGTCSLYWGRDTDSRSGKYILGFMTPHFITDGRRRLNLVRCMLDLLATPGRAAHELAAHFSGKMPIVEIPPAWESLCPDMRTTDPAELAKAKEAFDELVKFRSKPRFVRQIWSTEETKRILKACKAHGVTITHLANIASAFATVQHPGAADRNGVPRDEDSYYFEFSQAIDLSAKVPRLSNNGEMRRPFACRQIGRPGRDLGCRAPIQGAERRLREVTLLLALQWFLRCDRFENYMAQMTGKPFVPYMSSLGDLKSILPIRYPVQLPHVNGDVDGSTSHSAEVRILDQITSGKIDPQVSSFLMYTFDESLNLQFKWNAGRSSYSQVADDEGTM